MRPNKYCAICSISVPLTLFRSLFQMTTSTTTSLHEATSSIFNRKASFFHCAEQAATKIQSDFADAQQAPSRLVDALAHLHKAFLWQILCICQNFSSFSCQGFFLTEAVPNLDRTNADTNCSNYHDKLSQFLALLPWWWEERNAVLHRRRIPILIAYSPHSHGNGCSLCEFILAHNRLELSSKLLVPHKLTWQALVLYWDHGSKRVKTFLLHHFDLFRRWRAWFLQLWITSITNISGDKPNQEAHRDGTNSNPKG